MDRAEKDEWIAERAAIIWEGEGCGNDGAKVIAEMQARKCWEATFGDPQRTLF